MNEKEKRAMIYFDETLTNKCDIEFWKRVKNLIDKYQKEIEHELNQRKYWRDNFYKQQKEIAELMKICDLYKNASEHCAENFLEAIKPNYISKDKIREKIKEYEEKFNKYSNYTPEDFEFRQEYLHKFRVLKELLEEK